MNGPTNQTESSRWAASIPPKAMNSTPPKMIFWNVSSEPALPICLDNINTTITSGWSQNTLKYIMEDKEISPMSVLNEVLQSPNYSDIYKWFN